MSDLDKVVGRLREQLTESLPLIKEPRIETLNLDLHAKDTATMEMKCPLCHGTTRITVSVSKHARWRAGTYVQDVWSNATQGERETLITGIHSECFDEAFGGDDE